MRSLDDLPVFEDVDADVTLLDPGTSAHVYVINSRLELVAKVLHGRAERYVFSPRDIPLLQMEYHFGRELYYGGVSVAKPEGVFAINLPTIYPLVSFVPAFIMEDVKGESYLELDLSGQKRAEELHARELSKAIDLGFQPSLDHHPRQNCLYRLEEDKVILFDFGNWGKRA